ncbi:hypothetical protein BDV3_000828 [Batrachochytrium dendrobatidis]
MFIPTVAFAFTFASCILAIPLKPVLPELQYIYRRSIGTKQPFFFPSASYEHVGSSKQGSSFSGSSSLTGSGSAPVNLGDFAIEFLSKLLNLDKSEFKIYNEYTDSSGTTHIYGAQITAEGARIANHQWSVNIQNNVVISYSASFGTENHIAKRDLKVAPAESYITVEEAIANAVKQTGVQYYADVAPTNEYIQTPDGS